MAATAHAHSAATSTKTAATASMIPASAASESARTRACVGRLLTAKTECFAQPQIYRKETRAVAVVSRNDRLTWFRIWIENPETGRDHAESIRIHCECGPGYIEQSVAIQIPAGINVERSSRVSDDERA